MVCQNQTVAESNAPLAADMRQQIREQLGQGRSEQQIRDYFEERYGAFVRYDPPFMPSTWLLWLGPFVLLAVGFAALWRVVSRHGRSEPAPLTPAERERADALLKGDAP
jgi:cytochrome c-type biogenesis protein CcmH